MQQVAGGFARRDQFGKHLQRRDQTVARGRIVGKNDMPRLLATDVETAGAHPFEHITVADAGALERQPFALQVALEAQIRHHGRDNAAAPQHAAARPADADERHQLVTVNNAARLINNDQPVRVAIERDADVRAAGHHGFLEHARRGRSAFVVDVLAIGIDAHGNDFGAELPQRRRCHLIGCPIGAIERDLQTVEAEMAGESRFCEVDIPPARILHAARATDMFGLDQRDVAAEQSLDLGFRRIGQFIPVGAEQLDPIVIIRIVARRNHNAEISAH